VLTPADVRRLLAEHGLAPHKTLGQNFVVDPNTVRKIARDAGIRPGDHVVEIGPGLGSLTLALREAGATVTAVEIDAGMVRALTAVAGADAGVEVVHADAMAVDLVALVGDRPAKLVANLPYNVATPLVITALESHAFSELLVMVQKEVGQRWAASVGHPLYSSVSVKVSAMADAAVVAAVSRNVFYPVPNVDSVTVRLVPRPWQHPVDAATLFAVVDRGFGQRRKRLRNALATADAPPVDVEAALSRAGLDVGARAEELDLNAWVRLCAALTPPLLPPSSEGS
jgi:16S rRNA (adenine1518-N6/adenine1519-N6)-dimethyltransferase